MAKPEKITLYKCPHYDITTIAKKSRVIIEGVYSDTLLSEGEKYEVFCPGGEGFVGTVLSLNCVSSDSDRWNYRIIIMEFSKTFSTDPIVNEKTVCDFLNSQVMHPLLFEPCRHTSAIDITIEKSDYIEDSNIIKKDAFYTELESLLSVRFGIKGIHYNNTRSCFWHPYIKRG